MKVSSNLSSLKIAVSFDYHTTYGYFLKSDVVHSLRSRGAQIIPLLYETHYLQETLEDIDGLIIPGGLGDLHPNLYGESIKYPNVKVIQERCDFEFELLKNYMPMQKPLLCICWGHQMLNVFLGGSLFQDLPSDHPSSIQHEQKEPPHMPTHWVHFVKGSEAEKLWGCQKLFVNSTHHQAIKNLSPHLELQGSSEDGIAEIVRKPDHPFCWGVQWHPERLKDDPVIPAFLEACRRSSS